jgi:polyhydroxyalkanoate synthesis regulator phasin
VQTLLKTGQQTSDRAKEMMAASQEAVGQFQRRIDERVRTAVEGMSSLSDLRREVNELTGRIGDLERKLRDLEDKKP